MFRNNFLRLAVAVGIVSLIGSQLPQSGGTALAADSYNLAASSSSSGVIEGAVIGLFGLGVADSFGVVKGAAGAAPALGGGVAGGSGASGALLPPIPGGDSPIYDVTGKDPDLSAFYKDETALQDNSTNIASSSSKDVLKAANGNKKKYTVFAPIDTAIGAVSPAAPASAINPMNATGTVSQINLATISKLFAFHIIPARQLTISDLKQLPGATSESGAEMVTMDGTSVYIKFTPGSSPSDMGLLQISNAPFGTSPAGVPVVIATVHQTDEHASNGIIHPIDAVLIPASLAGGAGG